jgi:soluble lytic murein transglycosylase-like protein
MVKAIYGHVIDYWLKNKLNKMHKIKTLIILLLQKVIELLKLLSKKKDKKYFKQYALDMAKKYNVDGKVMVAVIEAESGFNQYATNHNENGTTDYGICQINDYW